MAKLADMTAALEAAEPATTATAIFGGDAAGTNDAIYSSDNVDAEGDAESSKSAASRAARDRSAKSCLICGGELLIAAGYTSPGCGHLYCLGCLEWRFQITTRAERPLRSSYPLTLLLHR